MSKYLNPFTDFGFKKLFGEESSRESLISFLNELLRPENVQIASVTYLNNEQLGMSEEARKVIYDIYCTDERGNHFIVEMQCQRHLNFKERMIFYSTYPIHQQAKRGNWDFELSAVYVIAILDFQLDDSPLNEVISFVKLANSATGDVFYEKLTYVFLEMPKFKKQEEDLVTHFDKWLFLIGRMDRLKSVPKTINEPFFMKFLEQAELAKLNDSDRARYESSLKIYRDNQLVLKSAKVFGYEEGKVVGLAEGKAEVARNLLKLGIDLQTVMKATGLTFDEVADLKTSI